MSSIGLLEKHRSICVIFVLGHCLVVVGPLSWSVCVLSFFGALLVCSVYVPVLAWALLVSFVSVAGTVPVASSVSVSVAVLDVGTHRIAGTVPVAGSVSVSVAVLDVGTQPIAGTVSVSVAVLDIGTHPIAGTVSVAGSRQLPATPVAVASVAGTGAVSGAPCVVLVAYRSCCSSCCYLS